jgi:hypothetical protein
MRGPLRRASWLSGLSLTLGPRHAKGAGLATTYLTGLCCLACGADYPAEARSICEDCFGPLEPSYDLERIRSEVTRRTVEDGPPSLWRFAPLLPASRDARVDLGDGWTPLRRAERLGAELGLRRLYVKDETRNPMHSFKDRVVSVALSRVRELGLDTVACASTGNPGPRRRRARPPGGPRSDPARRHRGRVRHGHGPEDA